MSLIGGNIAMNLKLIFKILTLSCLGVSNLSFASNDPLLGKWKTIDVRTGYSLSDVIISKNTQGYYDATIVSIRSVPGAETPEVCQKCMGPNKNKPLLGFKPLVHLKVNPTKNSEFFDGSYLDPRTGKTYQTNARLSNNGKHLIIRNIMQGSSTGQSLTWVKY